jgi:hypothetical protein
MLFAWTALFWCMAASGADTEGETEPSAGAAEAGEKSSASVGHPFSWPFVGWESMEPRGGTTQGAETTLAAEPNPAFARIGEPGLTDLERDRRAILALAGDHRVSFDFIETASSAHPYEPPRPYFSWATERAFVIENRPDFISIQHVLVMEFVGEDGEVRGPFTMKHWRQDWTHRDDRIFSYRGDRAWTSRALEESDGLWTLAVYQVDDSPRYEAVGRWDHRGGLSTFRSRSFWRPLPRREFSVRDDYNVLAGRHDITVTPTGWLHTQRNRKLVVEDGRLRRVLAEELGAVRYERITRPSLDAAGDYWRSTAPLWAAVREKWDAELSVNRRVRLRSEVEGRPLYQRLFELAGKLEDEKLGESERAKILAEAPRVIDRYLRGSDKDAGD